MRSIALIEGFSGGPIHTRGFRKALASAGFEVIRDRQRADIIIAHSAGIYAIPKNARAGLVMLIGPTYWPGRPLVKRLARHAREGRQAMLRDYGWKYLLWTQANQIFYFFARHWYMWLGILNNNKLTFLNDIRSRADRKIILVRNTEDAYCSPKIKEVIEDRPNIRYVEVPGVHDDFIKNPEPYIKLILEGIK